MWCPRYSQWTTQLTLTISVHHAHRVHECYMLGKIAFTFNINFDKSEHSLLRQIGYQFKGKNKSILQ